MFLACGPSSWWFFVEVALSMLSRPLLITAAVVGSLFVLTLIMSAIERTRRN